MKVKKVEISTLSWGTHFQIKRLGRWYKVYDFVKSSVTDESYVLGSIDNTITAFKSERFVFIEVK